MSLGHDWLRCGTPVRAIPVGKYALATCHTLHPMILYPSCAYYSGQPSQCLSM